MLLRHMLFAPLLALSQAQEEAPPPPPPRTAHGCVCLPHTVDYTLGIWPHSWAGCCGGMGWCDVEPGCAGAQEASDGYAGWDECSECIATVHGKQRAVPLAQLASSWLGGWWPSSADEPAAGAPSRLEALKGAGRAFDLLEAEEPPLADAQEEAPPEPPVEHAAARGDDDGARLEAEAPPEATAPPDASEAAPDPLSSEAAWRLYEELQHQLQQAVEGEVTPAVGAAAAIILLQTAGLGYFLLSRKGQTQEQREKAAAEAAARERLERAQEEAAQQRRKVLAAAASRIVLRMQRAALARAFEAWVAHAADAKRLAAVAFRVVARMQHALALRAFSSWADFAEQRRRLRLAAAKIQGRQLVAAFGSWLEAVELWQSQRAAAVRESEHETSLR